MPPRRTRAMGFSPGGAKALDIMAPTRKRKAKHGSQEPVDAAEASTTAQENPPKRTRANTTHSKSSKDEKIDEEEPSGPITVTARGRRMRTTRAQAAKNTGASDNNNQPPSDTTAAEDQSKPKRQTRAKTQNSNAVPTTEEPVKNDLALTTSVTIAAMKRGRGSAESTSPSDDGNGGKESITSIEDEERPPKRTRLQSFTSPRRLSPQTSSSSTSSKAAQEEKARPEGSINADSQLTASALTRYSEGKSENIDSGDQEVPDFGKSNAGDSGSDDDDAAGIDDHEEQKDQSYSFQPSAASKADSQEVRVGSITEAEAEIFDLELYRERHRSSAMRFAETMHRRKLEVPTVEYEDEDWELILKGKEPQRHAHTYNRDQINNARSLGFRDGVKSEKSRRTNDISKSRYVEWVDDSDAMFIIRKNESPVTTADSKGSTREDSLTSISDLVLSYHMAIPLTDPRIIDAVSTTLELCRENPQSIPTKNELSSFFKGFARSRQSPTVQTPSASPSETRQTSNTYRSPVTPTSQQSPSDSLISNTPLDSAQPATSEEPQEQAQHPAHQEEGRGGWATALSASRIGSLLQTPLRYFSRSNRGQPAQPQTDIRPSGLVATDTNVTRSENPQHRTTMRYSSRNSSDTPSRQRKPSNNLPTMIPAQVPAPPAPVPQPQQHPKGRRQDLHLPLHLRGVLYEDLPEEWKEASAHMKDPPPQSPQQPEVKQLTESERAFLNSEETIKAVKLQREKNLARIRSGKRPGFLPVEEDVTQMTQDLSQQPPGDKRKRVTFAAPELPKSNTFSVPDCDSSDEDEEAITASPSYGLKKKRSPSEGFGRKKQTASKRSPRLRLPGTFSPDSLDDDKDKDSPLTKKPRLESEDEESDDDGLTLSYCRMATKTGNPFLDATPHCVMGRNFTKPWKSPSFMPSDLSSRKQATENVFEKGTTTTPLKETSNNKRSKPVGTLGSQFGSKPAMPYKSPHQPKVSSGLRHMETMSSPSLPNSPATIPTPVTEVLAEDTVPFGWAVTDRAVIDHVLSIPDEVIDIGLELLPISAYKALVGEE